MNKVDKSIQLATQLFPAAYNARGSYQSFHFAFLYKRNTLISIGQNDTQQESAKAKKFANKFRVEKTKKYPYIHSEIDAISKVWGKQYIDNSYSMVIIRLNKSLDLQMNKPCQSCTKVLKALGLSKVWWSDKEGNVQYGI
jgi:deoxycytidylate deaminase